MKDVEREEGLGHIIDLDKLLRQAERMISLCPHAFTLLDANRKPLIAVGWSSVCSLYHRANTFTEQRCFESVDSCLSAVAEEEQDTIHFCKNGLPVLMWPVISNGQELGTIIVDQFRLVDAPLDMDYFSKQAYEFGFKTDSYLDALQSLPRIESKSAFALLDFYREYISDQLNPYPCVPSLSTADELLKRGLDKSGDSLFIADVKARTFAWVSTPFCERLGYSRHELMGMEPTDIVASSGAEELQQRFLSLFTERSPQIINSTYRTKDGQKIEVECHLSGFEFNGTQYVISISRDVSRFISMEERLQIKMELFEEFGKRLPMGFAINKRGSDYFQYMNRQFVSICGWPAKELENIDRMYELTIPDIDERERRKEIVRNEIKSGMKRSHLWRTQEITTSVGTKRFIDGTVVPLIDGKYLLAVLWDVTDQHDSLVALRESAEFMQQIVENINDVIYILGSDGRFEFVSPSSNEVLGYAPEEMQGKHFREFVLPEFLPIATAYIEQVLRKKRVSRRIEIKVWHSDKTERWASINASAIKGDQKNPRVLGVSRDITEQKEVQLKIRDYQDHLEELVEGRTIELKSAIKAAEEANRSKSEFLANMSHELRTPMLRIPVNLNGHSGSI